MTRSFGMHNPTRQGTAPARRATVQPHPDRLFPWRRAARKASAALAVLVVIGLTGCGTSKPGGETTDVETGAATGAADAAIDNSATRIDFQIQEYGDGQYGSGPVEVPIFAYDGAQPALDQFDHKNPELEAINMTIATDLLDPLNALLGGAEESGATSDDTGDDQSWAEIRSYPFTSEEYLQVVSTLAVFPNYGDDGEVFSWVFDRKANKWVESETVYAAAGLTADALLVAAREAYVPEAAGETVLSVEPAAFRYRAEEDGTYSPEFLLEAQIDNPAGDPWRGLFGYAHSADGGSVMWHLNPNSLFDPAELDTTDPPLAYARGGDAEGGPGLMFQLPLDAEVELLDQGFDPQGNPYARYATPDGLVSVDIRRGGEVAASTPEEIFAQVTASVSDGVEKGGSWRVEASEETAAAYSYPAHVFEYDEGANEDLRNHLGVYFQTDAGGWIVDAGIDADNYDAGHAAVEDWLKHLRVVDPAP
jgi:hypothetical protein